MNFETLIDQKNLVLSNGLDDNLSQIDRLIVRPILKLNQTDNSSWKTLKHSKATVKQSVEDILFSSGQFSRCFL